MKLFTIYPSDVKSGAQYSRIETDNMVAEIRCYLRDLEELHDAYYSLKSDWEVLLQEGCIYSENGVVYLEEYSGDSDVLHEFTDEAIQALVIS